MFLLLFTTILIINSYFIRDLMISSSSGSQLIDFAIGLINVIHLYLRVNSSMFKIYDNWSHSSWLGLMFLLFLHVKNFTITHMNSILHCLSHFLLIPDFSSINSLISLRILLLLSDSFEMSTIRVDKVLLYLKLVSEIKWNFLCF